MMELTPENLQALKADFDAFVENSRVCDAGEVSTQRQRLEEKWGMEIADIREHVAGMSPGEAGKLPAIAISFEIGFPENIPASVAQQRAKAVREAIAGCISELMPFVEARVNVESQGRYGVRNVRVLELPPEQKH